MTHKSSSNSDKHPYLITTHQMSQLQILISYSCKYEISVQFWPDQTAVYIAKDGVDLNSFGGDFDFAVGASIEYLDRINKKYSSLSNLIQK